MALDRIAWVVGGLLASAVTVGAGGYWLATREAPVEVVTTEPDANIRNDPQPIEVASESPAPPAPALPQPEAPAFDVVRVEPGGSTLIAGAAEPGTTVEILLDGKPVGTATADETGKFVAFADLPPSEQPRGLTLSTGKGADHLLSEQTVIVAPIAQPPVELSVPPSGEVSLAEPPVEQAPVVEAQPAVPTDVVPTVLLADKTGIAVLQAPEIADSPKNVSVDSITYDSEGSVFLSGRGTSDGSVRIYLDNSEITTAVIAGDGKWRTDLPDVDKGVYTLRVDQLNAEGKVVSRSETPFQREDAAKIAAENPEVVPEKPNEIKVITVQPGNTLWAIANENWGDGMLYVRMFEANKDRIRNPDLIYPGQVFDIPD